MRQITPERVESQRDGHQLRITAHLAQEPPGPVEVVFDCADHIYPQPGDEITIAVTWPGLAEPFVVPGAVIATDLPEPNWN